MTISPTTSKADRIYEFMREFHAENGYMPVVREIAEGLSLGSTSVIAYHLTKLELKGWITRHAGKARAIRLNR